MLQGLLLALFISHASHAADVDCKSIEISIPTPQRVSLVHPEYQDEFPEPELVKLSYLLEFCDEGDKISLVQTQVSTGKRTALEAYKSEPSHKIEKIYAPMNLGARAFEGVPNRIEIIDRNTYAMTDSQSVLPMAELQFYANDKLYSISTRRSTPEEWSQQYASELKREQNGNAKVQQQLQFSPFKPMVVSAPVPENAGIRLVWNRFSRSAHGKTYVLWTLHNFSYFEMTYLIEVESGIAVPLVEAYVGTPDGRMVIGAPQQQFKMLYFPELGRLINLDHMENEEQMDPMTYLRWNEVQNKKFASQHSAELAARYHGKSLTDDQAKIRKLFGETVDHETTMRVWLELLTTKDFEDFLKDKALARTRGQELSRFLLYREVPELMVLARKDERARESVDAFAEASSELLLARVLKGSGLRELVRLTRDEHECQALLAGGLKGDEGHEISRNMRKASLNLDILRTHLAKVYDKRE